MKLHKLLGILPLDLELERIIEKENLKKLSKLNKESTDTLNENYDVILRELTAEVSFELNLEIDLLVLIDNITPNLVQSLTGHGPFAHKFKQQKNR